MPVPQRLYLYAEEIDKKPHLTVNEIIMAKKTSQKTAMSARLSTFYQSKKTLLMALEISTRKVKSIIKINFQMTLHWSTSVTNQKMSKKRFSDNLEALTPVFLYPRCFLPNFIRLVNDIDRVRFSMKNHYLGFFW